MNFWKNFYIKTESFKMSVNKRCFIYTVKFDTDAKKFSVEMDNIGTVIKNASYLNYRFIFEEVLIQVQPNSYLYISMNIFNFNVKESFGNLMDYKFYESGMPFSIFLQNERYTLWLCPNAALQVEDTPELVEPVPIGPNLAFFDKGSELKRETLHDAGTIRRLCGS